MKSLKIFKFRLKLVSESYLSFSFSGEWRVFTGNELGALLGWWMLHYYHVRYPGSDLNDVYMLASTVSSKILRSMAKKEGFKFEVSVSIASS